MRLLRPQFSLRSLFLLTGLVAMGLGVGPQIYAAWFGERWQPYSHAALAAAREDGQTVLVNFVVDWGLYSQYVKTKTLEDPEIIGELDKKRVVLFEANVSSSSGEAWDLLCQLRGPVRSHVPLVAIYSEERRAPLLVDGSKKAGALIAEADVLAALEKAGPSHLSKSTITTMGALVIALLMFSLFSRRSRSINRVSVQTAERDG